VNPSFKQQHTLSAGTRYLDCKQPQFASLSSAQGPRGQQQWKRPASSSRSQSTLAINQGMCEVKLQESLIKILLAAASQQQTT
jgi:hypothetical protein